MSEEEKKYIDIFISKCEKYDESVEVKGVSVGEESRILDTVVKYLKLIEKQQVEIEEYKKANNYLQDRLNERPENPEYERKERLKFQRQNIQQNLIIHEMAQEIAWKEPLRYKNKLEVIEYFTNKVEEENK